MFSSLFLRLSLRGPRVSQRDSGSRRGSESSSLSDNSSDIRLSIDEVSNNLVCEICDECSPALIVSHPITSSCFHASAHHICYPCLERHIEAQMSNNSWDSIACWVHQCGAILQYQDMKRFATPFDFERYDGFLTAKAMGEEDTLIQCAHPGCRSRGYADLTSISFFDCPVCRGRTCVACHTPYHAGEPCPDSEEGKRRAQEDEDATVAEVARISKACPNECGARIEKNEGCDHMTCRRCKHEFCWLCLEPYEPIRRTGNSAHARRCAYYRP